MFLAGQAFEKPWEKTGTNFNPSQVIKDRKYYNNT